MPSRRISREFPPEFSGGELFNNHPRSSQYFFIWMCPVPWPSPQKSPIYHLTGGFTVFTVVVQSGSWAHKSCQSKKASNKKMRIWLELKWVATVWWTKMRVHKGTCLTRTSNTITDWRWFSMFGKGSQLEDTFKTWWSNQRKAASLRPATKIWRGDRVFPGPS